MTSITVAASEWIGCASRTHSIDVLVDAAQGQVMGFGLSINGARQDAISWDIASNRVDPATHTLEMTARERSTSPREFSLRISESSGRLDFRADPPEPEIRLGCFWGSIGQ